MEYSDNARALFETLSEHEEYRERVYYVINDEEKRKELNEQFPFRMISNDKFRDVLFILRSRYWFCSAMELPIATFFQRHVRQVVHLGHGMLVKKVGLIETGSSWYKKLYYRLVNTSFSYSVATSEFCKKDIVAGFGLPPDRILIMPQPKTSYISKRTEIDDQILANKALTHILYAPTWRPYAPVRLFPFYDFDLQGLNSFLVQNNTHIWLRVHPRFEQDIDLDLLNNSNIHLFSGKKYGEVNQYLSHFDGLITDYSSIYYDFLVLERPVLFFDYDLEQYRNEVGVIERYDQIKSSETTQNQQCFENQLLQIHERRFELEKIRTINELVNYPVPVELINEKVIHTLLMSKSNV